MTRHLLSVLSMALLAASAPAAVIYSGPQNIAIPFDLDGVFVNVFTNAVSYAPADYDTAPWINPFYGGACICTSPLIRPVVTSTLGAGDDQIVNLAYGTIVDHLSTFTVGYAGTGYNGSETHVGPAINQFQLGTQGYIAYEFEPTVGGPSYFGVMRITIANDGLNAIIHDWSYESISGMPVSVPEPGRALLLLGGLTGICLCRRREGQPSVAALLRAWPERGSATACSQPRTFSDSLNPPIKSKPAQPHHPSSLQDLVSRGFNGPSIGAKKPDEVGPKEAVGATYQVPIAHNVHANCSDIQQSKLGSISRSACVSAGAALTLPA